ncbi:MAG: cytosine permease [Lewinellaceae bacterium]|nr:cytosine permease [Lewinellaceae bacterium]
MKMEDISASPLYSEDFAPVTSSARNWTTWNFTSLWIGMAVCIPTYMLAGSMIREGMNWWQATLTILLGNLIVLLPMILNAYAGAQYGLPLPVLLRASFGTRGAVLAALLRGLVGCGWFGIQSWIGGEAIWDPVQLLGRFSSPVVVIISMVGLTIATLSTNIAANVVASANDIANIAPSKISFRMGGYITGFIGILIFPWKLLADPQGFIFVWLIGYSALLGALAGVMICDYYLIRKTRLNVNSLFSPNGEYGRWNWPAWVALMISQLPVLPGFLSQTGVVPSDRIPAFFQDLYTYGWFITFFFALVTYWILKTRTINRATSSSASFNYGFITRAFRTRNNNPDL